MISIMYEANDMDGYWSDASSMTDQTGATVQEVVEWICDEISVEAPEGAEIEAFFYDEETGDEVATAWIDEYGRNISMEEGYRD